jgi:hypothetical protein
MCFVELVVYPTHRRYDIRNFKNDLKEVLRWCGVEGKRVVVHLEDHQLDDPGILEAVNSLLAGTVCGSLTQTEDSMPTCVILVGE